MSSFTLADISGALSRLLDVPPGHPALARYAGQLESFVNSNAELQRTGLGGSGFQTIALNSLPPEVRELMSPAQQQDALRRQAERANVFSSDMAALAKFSGTLPAGVVGDGRGALRNGEREGSSARFDGINVSSLTPLQVQTRNYAIQQGVLWAADNPDILKLGAPAIDILKQTQLRKDVYEGLTKEAGLSAKGALGIAKLAKDRGEDANKAGEDIKDSLKAFNNPELKKAVEERGTLELDPKATEEQKKAASKNVDRLVDDAVKRNPSDAKHGETIKRTLGTAMKENAAQAAATASQTASAKVDVEANKGKAAFFNSPSPPASQQAQSPGKPAAAKAPTPN